MNSDKLQSIRDRCKWVGDCLVWQGPLTNSGYSHMTYQYKTYYGHRLVYMLTTDNWDLGFYDVVRHTCDNPRCLNFNHLRLGTHKDNTQDMIQKGRHYVVGAGRKKDLIWEGPNGKSIPASVWNTPETKHPEFDTIYKALLTLDFTEHNAKVLLGGHNG